MTSHTPIVPILGMVTLSNIASAFPGFLDPKHILAFKNAHPTIASAPIMSMNIFRGLTALSPSFNFSNVPAIGSNVTCALSNSFLAFSSAVATPELPAKVTIDLSLYSQLPQYQGPTSSTHLAFSLSNTSMLPSGVGISSNGILTVNATSPYASQSTLTVVNGWSNSIYVPLSFSFLSVHLCLSYMKQ